MERKLDAGLRPARSIAKYTRPKVAVAPRTYMDVMSPTAARPAQPVSKQAHQAKSSKGLVQLRPQPKPSTFFDVKPPAPALAPSKSITRIAPAIKPISKDITPPEVALVVVDEHVSAPAPVSSVAPEQVPSVEPTARSHEAQEGAEKEPAKKKKTKRVTKKQRMMHTMAAILFLAGVYVTVDGWLANRAVTTQANVLSAQAEKDGNAAAGPSGVTEGTPPVAKGYRVAAELPRLIKIPSLGVSARILHLNVKTDNSLAAPPNIYDAGWYVGSSRPADQRGAMLIDGHVSGPTKPGVFYGLKKMKAGDEIVIERGDGQLSTFIVQKTETVQSEDVDMAKMLRSVDEAKLGLNLITCGGSFDVASNQFKSRTLVYAVQK